MKAVIQRVKGAVLSVDGKIVSQIGKGLVIYFCVEKCDAESLSDIFVKKVTRLRIFADSQGKMNLSVKDIGGEILFVSQFTLAADLSCGNRPGFSNAEQPDIAQKIYLNSAQKLLDEGVVVKLGVFGADMLISQDNDGPVTINWEAK